MTPQEKANELVENFIQFADDDYWETTPQYELNETKKANAKQCALIAVEEIKKAHPIIPLTYMLESEAIDAAIEYWNEVKAEIEKL